MEKHKEAMLKSLVAIGWADGRFADEEGEVLEAMAGIVRIDASGKEFMRAYARTPRSLDDVPVADLGAGDRELLVRYAVILSFIDGEQGDDEREVIAAVVKKLGIPQDEAAQLILAAEAEARMLIE